ncbi:hypothetical protein IC762_28920 [Bradyrhizobium genosp. L]|uniref:hypothetical protein n=1 Tax=Bradyrhizobium genosp. L TaxID=83637 RepID=UPI0018A33845|nr:hypothetical protein [Bradyrhizobium genosp. L]QPF83685.1 hypothetical protein IC762_28920 [Bradyrhizobium genosp. L]
MKFKDGNENLAAFAANLNSRIEADARIKRAVAFGWLCGGCAIAACLISAGCAVALWGYSYTISVNPSAEIVARALNEAFQRAQIKTSVSGTMVLANTEVNLAKNQTVKLAEGSTVKLDPASSIRVTGDFRTDVPQPSKRQLQLDATANSKELPFTRYTVFKSAPFGAGVVVTGWSFELSDTSRPQVQRCYYEEILNKGVAANQTIAIDGAPRRPAALTKLTFDFDGALGNCIWFSGL